MKKKQVYKSFKAYIDLAGKEFEENENLKKRRKLTVMTSSKGKASYIKLPPKQIRGMGALLATLEDSEEFLDLVSNISEAFGGEPVTESESSSYYDDRPFRMVKNFFRRSGLYIALSKNEHVDCRTYFEQLWCALKPKIVKTVSLRLIEMVDFKEHIIDLGKFKIQKFSKAELDEMFENDLRNVFYPYAVLDTATLSQYWFIVEETAVRRRTRFERSPVNIGFSMQELLEGRLPVRWEFPERTLQLLALFDWESFTDNALGWIGFRVPFSLEATDDILVGPSLSPRLAGLETYPVGEEAWELPYFPISFSKGDDERLKEVVSKAKAFIQSVSLSGCHWEFIERAMGYLAKALYADGLEQLLWHMIVLETLFGESPETTESIARRVSAILGETENSRKAIKKTFKDLYDFRCDLVHGREFRKQVMKKHLAEARSLSRKSLVWFLTYLSDMHNKLKRSGIQPSDYPRRNELLALLDHKKDGLGRLGVLLKKSPTDFPNLNIWGEE